MEGFRQVTGGQRSCQWQTKKSKDAARLMCVFEVGQQANAQQEKQGKQGAAASLLFLLLLYQYFFVCLFTPVRTHLTLTPFSKPPQPHSSVTCNRKSFLISFCVLTALYSCAFWPWKYRKTEVPSRGSRQKV